MKKIFRVLKFYLLKLKYISNKNIKLPKIMQLPINSNIEIAKNAVAQIKKIGINSNVNIRIREGAFFSIGSGCFFNNNCIITCRKNIKIGNNVIFGPNVAVFDHDHNYFLKEDRKKQFLCEDIVIEDNVWIGANVTILKGSYIMKNSVIAAGSIVNGLVDENVIYYNPIQKKEKKIEFE